MSKTYRRRRFFLPHTSQLRLLILAQIILIMALLVSGYLFYKYMYVDLEEGFLTAHQRIGNTMDLLLPGLLLMCAVTVILALAANLFFTHRIVGPVYRMCKVLRDVGQGDLGQSVKFRDHDSLTELAHAANRMLDALSSQLGRLRSGIADVHEELKSLNGGASTAVDLEKIGRIREQVGRLQEELDSVRLQGDPPRHEAEKE